MRKTGDPSLAFAVRNLLFVIVCQKLGEERVVLVVGAGRIEVEPRAAELRMLSATTRMRPRSGVCVTSTSLSLACAPRVMTHKRGVLRRPAAVMAWTVCKTLSQPRASARSSASPFVLASRLRK